MSDQSNQGGSYGGFHTLYAGPIHEAIRSGDQERMRQMEQHASRYVSDIRSALEELRGKQGTS